MTRRWTNQSLPQTLQIGVLIAYFRAIFTLLFGLDLQFLVFPLSDLERNGVSNPLLRLGLPALLAGGAYLVTQEKHLGYRLVIVGAALPVVARLLLGLGMSFGVDIDGGVSPLDYDVLGFMFEVALLALFLHPQSREYEKIWFK